MLKLLSGEEAVLYTGEDSFGDAHIEMRKFAELTGIPVASALMGLGADPDTQSLYWFGMHGTVWAVYDSDLLICAGARFDDRITGKVDRFATEATIITSISTLQNTTRTSLYNTPFTRRSNTLCAG